MNDQRPEKAIVAGFCASTASALILLFAHIGAKILYEGAGGTALFGALIDNSLTALAGSNLYLAISLHFLVGMSLGYLYFRVKSWLPANTWEAGLVFMTPPFLFSVFVLFPLTGGGLLGMEYGAGLLPAVGSLVLHAVYGVVMVALYERPASFYYGTGQARGRHLPARRHGDVITGLLYGTAIGASTTASMWFLFQDSLVVPGLPMEFTFMAITFFFASMGLLIGFWTGASSREAVYS